MEIPTLQMRHVTDPGDPAIREFGRLQGRTFAEPDMLIPAAILPQLIRASSPDRRNYVVVAEAEGQVVGGSVFHYFPGPNTGFSSFLTVAPQARGSGVARALHTARFALLDREAGRPVRGLFIDVVAPERLSRAEIERERRVGADPVERRRIFHRLGFRKVDVEYYQPAEGSGGEAITTMDLLFCPRTPMDAVPSELVAETMKAYWMSWLGRGSALRNAAELRRRCGGESARLLPAFEGGARE